MATQLLVAWPSSSAQLGTSVSTLYTVPAGKTARSLKALFTNTTGTDRTITVYIVRNGAGGAGVENMIINAKNVAAGTTYDSPELQGLTLNAGDFITAKASAVSAISPSGSVTEFTPS